MSLCLTGRTRPLASSWRFLPFLFLASQLLLLAISSAYDNSTDFLSLLAFKAGVVDQHGILDSNWTSTDNFCNWAGISCSRRRQRVTSLRLPGYSLQGTISPHLANLSFLSVLDLSSNSLTGHIPDSLCHLPRLSTFVLSHNRLSGSVPSNVFNMSSLINIYFGSNNLSGSFPKDGIGTRRVPLQLISISNNHHTGDVPWRFNWFPDLQVLDFTYNEFSGTIPAELDNVPKLRVLYLGGNLLHGTIPASLGNLTSLNWLSLGSNNLEGAIPEEFGNLSSLGILNLEASGVSGPIPVSLTNASKIYSLGLNQNKLTGSLPATLGNSMPRLYHLYLGQNQLSGGLDFIHSLTNCRSLEFLDVSGNELRGILPDSVGNLSSNLHYFHTEQNHIKGTIPASLGNLSSLGLQHLALAANRLSSSIPQSLWDLRNLVELNLSGNTLNGSLSSQISNLKIFNTFDLSKNQISGSVTDAVGELQMLTHLDLSNNSLQGQIPQSLEYGFGGKLSRRSDVYSFGILLLETFTRRKPTDAMFDGELSLRKWVQKAHPNALSEIIDSTLLRDEYSSENESPDTLHRCLSSIVELGLLCSRESPNERILIKEVAPKMQKIRLEYSTNFA